MKYNFIFWLISSRFLRLTKRPTAMKITLLPMTQLFSSHHASVQRQGIKNSKTRHYLKESLKKHLFPDFTNKQSESYTLCLISSVRFGQVHPSCLFFLGGRGQSQSSPPNSFPYSINNSEGRAGQRKRLVKAHAISWSIIVIFPSGAQAL